jgi:SHS2 domain-containing protein
MPHEFFEHKADIGIRGIGKNLQEAFEEAAKAMFEVMFDLRHVTKDIYISVNVNAQNVEELLVEWLNALLAEKDIHNAVFAHFKIEKIEQAEDGSWVLEGKAYGEEMNIEKHKPEVEVKAATYSQLKVYQDKNKLWVAQCVVDV